jgi:hypothetical protein
MPADVLAAVAFDPTVLLEARLGAAFGFAAPDFAVPRADAALLLFAPRLTPLVPVLPAPFFSASITLVSATASGP